MKRLSLLAPWRTRLDSAWLIAAGALVGVARYFTG